MTRQGAAPPENVAADDPSALLSRQNLQDLLHYPLHDGTVRSGFRRHKRLIRPCRRLRGFEAVLGQHRLQGTREIAKRL